VIPAESDRLAALKRGDIDGFDFVAPQDASAVRGDPELRLLERPPSDVGYVTINQTPAASEGRLQGRRAHGAVDPWLPVRGREGKGRPAQPRRLDRRLRRS
jgi:peptide/nickel transport system substrate-binding protein